MRAEEMVIYISALPLLLIYFLAPKVMNAKARLQAGALLLIIGFVGLIGCLRLADVGSTSGLMLACMLAVAVASALLVSAFFDWLGLTRPKHQRRRFPPFAR